MRKHLILWLAVCAACDPGGVDEPASPPEIAPGTASESLEPATSARADPQFAPATEPGDNGAAAGPPPDRDPRGSAFGFDPGPIRSAEAYLAEPRFAAADLERGELLSFACRACHTFGPGGQHNIGPNLYGIFGRRAAQATDFAYSEALRSAGLVWTPRALEAWLMEPQAFIVGNNMAFAGYRSETDRRDLIAFLLAVTTASAPAASVE